MQNLTQISDFFLSPVQSWDSITWGSLKLVHVRGRYWTTFVGLLSKARNGSRNVVERAQQRRLIWMVRP